MAQLVSDGVRGEIAISVVTAMELEHGVARAESEQRRKSRQNFLFDLLSAVPVYPISLALALTAGRLDGELTARGIRTALADLLIGVTALELDYAIATLNIKHFAPIPGVRLSEIA